MQFTSDIEWYVMRVTYQRELIAQKVLDSMGVESFVPTVLMEKKQKKASKAYRRNPWHKVRRGESMYSISQLYGIRLNKLYKMNYMSEVDVIKEGDLLKVR